MALETEVKFPDCDIADLEARLARLGATLEHAGFESNIVYDTPDRALRADGRLLRLRQDREIELTLKLPVIQPDAGMKTREELEVRLDDHGTAQRILEGLGYVEALRYEKYRRTWRLGDCLICLDTLPFGDFAELEGPPGVIRQTAQELGLDLDKSSVHSYHSHYQEFLAATGQPPDDSFVFSPMQKKRLPK